MIRVVLVGIVEALDQTVSDAARHRHGQVALIKVEARFHYCVLDVVYNLLLDEPTLVPQVGAHEAPELGIHFLLWMLSGGRLMPLVHFLVLEFWLLGFQARKYLRGMRDAHPCYSCWTCWSETPS